MNEPSINFSVDIIFFACIQIGREIGYKIIYVQIHKFIIDDEPALSIFSRSS